MHRMALNKEVESEVEMKLELELELELGLVEHPMVDLVDLVD